MSPVSICSQDPSTIRWLLLRLLPALASKKSSDSLGTMCGLDDVDAPIVSAADDSCSAAADDSIEPRRPAAEAAAPPPPARDDAPAGGPDRLCALGLHGLAVWNESSYRADAAAIGFPLLRRRPPTPLCCGELGELSKAVKERRDKRCSPPVPPPPLRTVVECVGGVGGVERAPEFSSACRTVCTRPSSSSYPSPPPPQLLTLPRRPAPRPAPPSFSPSTTRTRKHPFVASASVVSGVASSSTSDAPPPPGCVVHPASSASCSLSRRFAWTAKAVNTSATTFAATTASATRKSAPLAAIAPCEGSSAKYATDAQSSAAATSPNRAVSAALSRALQCGAWRSTSAAENRCSRAHARRTTPHSKYDDVRTARAAPSSAACSAWTPLHHARSSRYEYSTTEKREENRFSSCVLTHSPCPTTKSKARRANVRCGASRPPPPPPLPPPTRRHRSSRRLRR
eukprot:Rhum_TRINITY_DN14531_c30_g1::Rhum_TRINITY_DN14531_c30_g1_i1::g.97845::m.97845